MESDLHLPGFPICGKRHRWDECGGKVVISSTFENESLFSSSACSFHNVCNTKRQQGCRLNTTVIVVIAFEFVFLAGSHNWVQTCELCDIRMTRDITAIYRAQCFNEIQSDSYWCFHFPKKLHTPPWEKKKRQKISAPGTWTQNISYTFISISAATPGTVNTKSKGAPISSSSVVLAWSLTAFMLTKVQSQKMKNSWNI